MGSKFFFATLPTSLLNIYTPSVLKYKKSNFILNQTIINLIRFIEKKKKYVLNIEYIMEYIFTIYLFDAVDINVLFRKLDQN